jgi:GNAT superfamily N-acetyltransferase
MEPPISVSARAITASAMSSARERLELAAAGGTLFVPSRLFGYSVCKKLDGLDCAGTTGWWGSRIEKGYGMCDERLCPYGSCRTEAEVLRLAISAEAYQDAYRHRSFVYQRFYTLNDIKRVFSPPFRPGFGKLPPITLPIICIDLFDGSRDAPKGHIPVPDKGAKRIEGHAVLVVGYNDNAKELIFWNSWGSNWGDNGFGYLPYEFFSRNYVTEAWSSLPEKVGRALRTPHGSFAFRDKTNERIKAEYSQIRAVVPGRPYIWVIDLYNRYYEIVGWAHCSFYVDRDLLEIEELFIMPSYRRRGLGKALLARIEHLAKFHVVSKIMATIHRQDLLPGREKTVQGVFQGSGFTIRPEFARFRDCWRCAEKLI